MREVREFRVRWHGEELCKTFVKARSACITYIRKAVPDGTDTAFYLMVFYNQITVLKAHCYVWLVTQTGRVNEV